MRTITLGITAFVMLAGLGSSAQQTTAPKPAEQPPITFKVEVNYVEIDAIVTDQQGNFVRNLTKDDFSISEDGRPQAIRYFSAETNLPLTIGLLVDTSTSQEKVLNAERGASFRFIDSVLRENMEMMYQFENDYRFSSGKLEQAFGLSATSYREGIAATLRHAGIEQA